MKRRTSTAAEFRARREAAGWSLEELGEVVEAWGFRTDAPQRLEQGLPVSPWERKHCFEALSEAEALPQQPVPLRLAPAPTAHVSVPTDEPRLGSIDRPKVVRFIPRIIPAPGARADASDGSGLRWDPIEDLAAALDVPDCPSCGARRRRIMVHELDCSDPMSCRCPSEPYCAVCPELRVPMPKPRPEPKAKAEQPQQKPKNGESLRRKRQRLGRSLEEVADEAGLMVGVVREAELKHVWRRATLDRIHAAMARLGKAPVDQVSDASGRELDHVQGGLDPGQPLETGPPTEPAQPAEVPAVQENADTVRGIGALVQPIVQDLPPIVQLGRARDEVLDVGHSNGNCIHNLDPRTCTPCLGQDRPPVGQNNNPRRGAPQLGPRRADAGKLRLGNNYRPPRTVLAPNWAPNGQGCGGLAKAKKATPKEPATVELPQGFADLARQRFRASGLTYLELARRIGGECRPSSIQNYINPDRRRMERDRYEALCRELGIDQTALQPAPDFTPPPQREPAMSRSSMALEQLLEERMGIAPQELRGILGTAP